MIYLNLEENYLDLGLLIEDTQLVVLTLYMIRPYVLGTIHYIYLSYSSFNMSLDDYI